MINKSSATGLARINTLSELDGPRRKSSQFEDDDRALSAKRHVSFNETLNVPKHEYDPATVEGRTHLRSTNSASAILNSTKTTLDKSRPEAASPSSLLINGSIQMQEFSQSKESTQIMPMDLDLASPETQLAPSNRCINSASGVPEDVDQVYSTLKPGNDNTSGEQTRRPSRSSVINMADINETGSSSSSNSNCDELVVQVPDDETV